MDLIYTLTINTVKVSSLYPTGYTRIFLNKMKCDQDALFNYSVVPRNGIAPMRIATQKCDSFLKGAVGKTVVFDNEWNSNPLQVHYNCIVGSINCTVMVLDTIHTTSGVLNQRSAISAIWLWIISTLFARFFSW